VFLNDRHIAKSGMLRAFGNPVAACCDMLGVVVVDGIVYHYQT